MVGEAQRSRAPIQRLADRGAGVFCAGGAAVAVVTFVAWALLGPEPRFGLRPGQCGGGADHRLPVCPGAGDADVDHGRGRAAVPRRACLSMMPKLWNSWKSRHARGRQNRHAYRRQTAARVRRAGRRHGRRRIATPGGEPRAGQRTSAGGGHRAGARETAVCSWPRCKILQSITGKGVHGRVEGHSMGSAIAHAR